MRGVIVMSFFVFVLAGCATAQVASDRWTKPGSRSDDLAVDLYICEQWSRSAEHLRDCMTGHGWKEAASEP